MGSIAYKAPHWPITVLNDLGRHVFRSRRPYRADDFVEGLRWGAGAKSQAVVVPDPDLGDVTTPNGVVSSLQVVTIDAAALDLLKGNVQSPTGYADAIREVKKSRSRGICGAAAS